MIALTPRLALAVVLATTLCRSAAAQSLEMSGMIGFTPSTDLERLAPELADLSIPGAFTWSVQGGHFFTPHWGVEGTFAQQRTALDVGTTAGTAELYPMTLAQVEGQLVYQFGEPDARLRPFVFGGAGATIFTAHDLESDAKAAFGLGAGLKYFRWDTVGLRGQFRYKPTRLNDDPEGDFCAPFGFCQRWLQQIEVALGAVIRF